MNSRRRFFEAPPFSCLACVHGASFDEAELIAPRIIDVERALTPGLDADVAAALAVNTFI